MRLLKLTFVISLALGLLFGLSVLVTRPAVQAAPTGTTPDVDLCCPGWRHGQHRDRHIHRKPDSEQDAHVDGRFEWHDHHPGGHRSTCDYRD